MAIDSAARQTERSKTSTASYSKRLYRFALYGNSGSGKTCVLARMALGAVGHPGELTSAWLPVVVPKPDGDQSSWGLMKREAASLHRGKEWIDEAVAKLRQGKCPGFNPPVLDGGIPASVDFEITSPGRGTTRIRTIDYSGELINPDDESDPEALATTLKRLLRGFDGFLIIAETPRPDGSDKQGLGESLVRLRRAFASLQEDHNFGSKTPVIVMLTKWDRASNINYTASANEYDKVDGFLAEHEHYKALVNAVRHGVATSAASSPGPDEEILLASGRWAFPSSAFGRADVEDGGERPSAENNRPFGLLDPFLVLADRRDALDAEELERKLCERGRFFDWFLGFRRCWKLSQRAEELTARLPHNSLAGEMIHRCRSASSRRWIACLVTWAVIVSVAIEVGYEGVRGWQFALKRDVALSQLTPDDGLLEARRWLEDYRRSWRGLMGLAPPAKEADRLVSTIDDAREKRYWLPDENTQDSMERFKAAKIYIEKLPNGEHVAQARQFVEEGRIIEARARNERNLNRLETEFLKTSRNNLDKTYSDVEDGSRHLEDATPDQHDRWNRLLSNIGRGIADRNATLYFEQWVKGYRDALARNDFGTAAEHLVKYTRRDEHWKRITEGFAGEVSSRAKRVAEQRLSDRQFRDAEDVAEQARESLRLVEMALRPKEPKLAEGALQGQRDIGQLQREVVQAEDQYYYEKVQSQKDMDACKAYLGRFKSGSMARQVEAYQDYLAKLDKPLELVVAAWASWDKTYPTTGGNHVVTVRCNDRVDLTVKGLRATPGELSGEVGRFQLNGTLPQSIVIRADIIDDGFFYDGDAGSGLATFRVSDFREERPLRLRPSNGLTFENELRLRIIEGLPQEPELPPWKSQ